MCGPMLDTLQKYMKFQVYKCICTVKPVLNGHSKEGIFKTDDHIMQVESIAECSAKLSTCITLPPVFKIFISSIY